SCTGSTGHPKPSGRWKARLQGLIQQAKPTRRRTRDSRGGVIEPHLRRITAVVADLLDANECTWEFVGVDRVVRDRKWQARRLEALASDGLYWNYCGRTADDGTARSPFRGERAGAGRPRRKVAVQGVPPNPSRRLEPSGTPDGHRQVGRADLVALTVSGGVNDGLDHALRVEAWWRLARREVLEGGDVLLNDRRRRHHGPQLLTGIHRVR